MHSGGTDLLIAFMIHALIFDLDGTLVHSLPGLAASLNRILPQAGLPKHPESVVRGFIGNGIRKLVERAVPEEFPQADLDKLVQLMNEDYASSWTDGTAPYTGVTDALEQLSSMGTQLSVLSNKPHQFCKKITDHVFPQIEFAAVLGLRDQVPAKPNPKGAIELAKTLSTPPTEIAFLGDSTMDIITARNAAMIEIAASWGYHDLPALKAENPTHLIHKVEDLIPLLKQINH